MPGRYMKTTSCATTVGSKVTRAPSRWVSVFRRNSGRCRPSDQLGINGPMADYTSARSPSATRPLNSTRRAPGGTASLANTRSDIFARKSARNSRQSAPCGRPLEPLRWTRWTWAVESTAVTTQNRHRVDAKQPPTSATTMVPRLPVATCQLPSPPPPLAATVFTCLIFDAFPFHRCLPVNMFAMCCK
jgi:hypothetical protein